MTAVSAASAQAVVAEELQRCARVWGCRLDALEVGFSRRLTASLGRCRVDTGQITLAAWLLDAPEALLREVVVHEAAHAVARPRELGRGLARERPHGPVWRALMVEAGCAPRATVPAQVVDWHRPARPLVEHRCPRCGAVRNARRRVPEWRCTACRRRGFSGRLLARRLPAAPSTSSPPAGPTPTGPEQAGPEQACSEQAGRGAWGP